MAKYLVIELQTNTDETMGSQVTSFTERDKAESKYHTVLAAAALSAKPVHAAMLITNDGFTIESKCYKHDAAPIEVAPEVEGE